MTSVPGKAVAVLDHGSGNLSGAEWAVARTDVVHTYMASDLHARHRAGAEVTTASRDEPFAAVVETGALSAARFHPGKRAGAGFALLRNRIAGL
jgi:imidazole glycerol-phosphate synthase subunit HisH